MQEMSQAAKELAVLSADLCNCVERFTLPPREVPPE
jgi:hypothetical protein